MESNVFSEIFLQLFLFFNYYRYIDKKKEFGTPTKEVILAGIFTLMSGKRLAMLMVIIMPIINFIIKKIQLKLTIEKKHLKPITIILVVLFTIATIIYLNMLQHKIFVNFDIYNFSTGRDYILSLWEKHNYISYGYGSSMLLIGRYLELDLIQIYLELNLFCLVLFIYIFMKMSNKTLYGLLIMSYRMLNLLTA